MRTQLNKKEVRKEWVIEYGHEKFVVVLGIAYGLVFIFFFLLGFMEGLMGK